MSEDANGEELNPYARLTHPAPLKIYYQIQRVKVSYSTSFLRCMSFTVCKRFC